MTCAKDKCIHREYCQRHIGQQEDGCVLYQRDNSPMTKEEWLRSCSADELAGAIYEWYTLGFTRGKNGVKLNSITEVVGWLKEKHKE